MRKTFSREYSRAPVTFIPKFHRSKVAQYSQRFAEMTAVLRVRRREEKKKDSCSENAVGVGETAGGGVRHRLAIAISPSVGRLGIGRGRFVRRVLLSSLLSRPGLLPLFLQTTAVNDSSACPYLKSAQISLPDATSTATTTSFPLLSSALSSLPSLFTIMCLYRGSIYRVL